MTYTEIKKLLEQIADLEQEVLKLIDLGYTSSLEKFVVIDNIESTLRLYQNLLRSHGRLKNYDK